MSDTSDRRGQMHRSNRQMPDDEARAFLRAQKVAHVATVGIDGWPGRPYACNSSLVYTSVITFGAFTVVDNVADKTWFFDRVLEKYGEAEWKFEPGYPRLDRIVLYEQRIDILTGKHSAGLSH